MANQYVMKRMEGMLNQLKATHYSLTTSASAVKGAGRADFINTYLREVIPAGLRISTNGEITDQQGNITGELDIIVENGHLPSLPSGTGNSARLFFAEGVAAVIEVKSNLQSQWNEVLGTGKKLALLDREVIGGTYGNHRSPMKVVFPSVLTAPTAANPGCRVAPHATDEIVKRVPYFVVGYTGWSNPETLEAKLQSATGVVSGILQIDMAYFVGGDAYGSIRSSGSHSLLAFINAVQEASSFIRSTSVDLLKYAK